MALGATTAAVKTVPYVGEFVAGQHSSLITRSYEVTINVGDAGDLLLDSGLAGYAIMPGGVTIYSDGTAASATATAFGVKYGTIATSAATALTTTTPIFSTVGAAVRDTEVTNTKLELTLSGTITAGKIYVTVVLVPLSSTKTKKAGVGN
jgi:hypothetical protein